MTPLAASLTSVAAISCLALSPSSCASVSPFASAHCSFCRATCACTCAMAALYLAAFAPASPLTRPPTAPMIAPAAVPQGPKMLPAAAPLAAPVPVLARVPPVPSPCAGFMPIPQYPWCFPSDPERPERSLWGVELCAEPLQPSLGVRPIYPTMPNNDFVVLEHLSYLALAVANE